MQEAAARPRAQQVTDFREKKEPWRDFDDKVGTQFVGYIGKDAKLKTNGDLELVITVPYQFKHLAIGLSDVAGLPLSIDVQLWKPYADARKNGHNGSQVV